MAASIFGIRIGAYALISVGFVVFWLPIPFGALMVACGLALLCRHDPSMTNAIRRQRRKRQRLHRLLLAITQRLPRNWRTTLERTDPYYAS